ncbi:MAG TPA: FAD:protein FMN transferase [Acidimicrobiia bacterium]
MRRVEELWGTAIGVEVVDDVDPETVDALYRWFERVDELFSTWREDSEISRIGRGELAATNASPEVATVLELCDGVCRLSGGAFDITFGARAALEPRPGLGPLDPSGLVKGWAVERAAAMLLDAGARSFCINAGGDVAVRGRPASGDAWLIGIQHPWERDKLAAVVRLVDGAVATSGCYERGDHVVDPRRGMPAHGLASVTVVGPDLTMADAYATAAFALGPDGMAWLAERPSMEAMAVTDARRVVTTAGFDRYRAS